MDALHLDARLAATSHWGKTNVQRRPNSPTRSPDLLATVRMAASASPPQSTRSLSSEHGKGSKVDGTVYRPWQSKVSTKEGRSWTPSRNHLDARSWTPSRESRELAVPEKLFTTQKDLRHRAVDWVPSNRLNRSIEELLEPLWKAHSEVLSQCSSHRKQHAELEAQTTKLSTEQEVHSAALHDLREVSSELRAAADRPTAAAQRWTQGSEPWRKELEVLRNEQRSALADQVHLLQKEFEAAYRAEQLADMAMNRVTKLEKGLSDMYVNHSVEDIARRVQRLEVERGGEGIRSHGMAAIAQTDGDRTSQVNQNLNDLASAVSCQAEKLCQVECEIANARTVQTGQLAEALAQSQRLSCGLDEERVTFQKGLADLRSDLQHSLTGIDTSEKKCMDMISHRCDTWTQELASQRGDLTRTAASARSAHEDFKRLGKSHEALVRQVEGLHHQMRECCTEVTQRCGEEAEARINADVQLRSELTNAMTVVKAQFDEWMEMVRVLKSDVADLSMAAKANLDCRAREANDRQTEVISLVELAQNVFKEAARLIPRSESLANDLDRRSSQMDVLATSFDIKQYCGNGPADSNTVSRLVADILGCVSQISKRCISECGNCKIEIGTVRDLSETLQQEHRDACRNLQKELSELRLELAKNSPTDSDWSQQASMMRKELDVALAALHTREEGRAMELADTLSSLSNRLLHLERSRQEHDEDKVRARQSILHAVDTIEAAAQRVASEASFQT